MYTLCSLRILFFLSAICFFIFPCGIFFLSSLIYKSLKCIPVSILKNNSDYEENYILTIKFSDGCFISESRIGTEQHLDTQRV